MNSSNFLFIINWIFDCKGDKKVKIYNLDYQKI